MFWPTQYNILLELCMIILNWVETKLLSQEQRRRLYYTITFVFNPAKQMNMGEKKSLLLVVIDTTLIISEDGHGCFYLLAIQISFCCEMPVLLLVPYLNISLFIVRSEILITTPRQLLQPRKTNAPDKGSQRHRPYSEGWESSPYSLAPITHLIKGTTYFQTLRAGSGSHS